MDVIFISYNEPNADENYKDLLTKFPNAKRVHGVDGLYESHYEASKLNESDYYITIDGDTIVWKDSLPTPNFTKPNQIFYYPTKNSILQVFAGGSIKFWAKDTITYIDRDYFNKIGEWYQIDTIDNVIHFRENNYFIGETIVNSSPQQAFISGFRETFKRYIQHQELTKYMVLWLRDYDVENAQWAKLGALRGLEFAVENQIRPQDVNDWQLLEEVYKSTRLEYIDNMPNIIYNIIRSCNKQINKVWQQ